MKFLKTINNSSEMKDLDYGVIYENKTDDSFKIKYPKIETVDLGLPSGNLWMTCNIGAKSPEQTGKYFQWGSLKGYYDASHSTCETAPFNKGAHEFNGDAWKAVSGDVITYNGTSYNLNLNYDAVYKATHGQAKLPSGVDFQELTANTMIQISSLNGVPGIFYTSRTDSTKQLFFPLCGYASNGAIVQSGMMGTIWAKEYVITNPGTSYSIMYYRMMPQPQILPMGIVCGCPMRGIAI